MMADMLRTLHPSTSSKLVLGLTIPAIHTFLSHFYTTIIVMISTKRLRILAFLLVFLSYTNTVSGLLSRFFWLSISSDCFTADQTDWVDPQYVVDEAIRGPKTPDAVKSIVHTAEKLSKKGPWSKSPCQTC